jgi:pyruvate-formate lyase
MTREAFDKAYVALGRIEKVKAIKAKIQNEFPEFGYDTESKEIGNAIYRTLDAILKQEQRDFDEL